MKELRRSRKLLKKSCLIILKDCLNGKYKHTNCRNNISYKINDNLEVVINKYQDDYYFDICFYFADKSYSDDINFHVYFLTTPILYMKIKNNLNKDEIILNNKTLNYIPVNITRKIKIDKL